MNVLTKKQMALIEEIKNQLKIDLMPCIVTTFGKKHKYFTIDITPLKNRELEIVKYYGIKTGKFKITENGYNKVAIVIERS